MHEREDHGERIHQRIWELVPWYVNGTLSGPGRWHIAGNAKVHTPWPLPDFDVEEPASTPKHA